MKYNKSYLTIILYFVSLSYSVAQPVIVSTVRNEDLQLELSTSSETIVDQTEVNLRLTNISDKNIEYSVVTEALGFYISLAGESGSYVALTEEAKRIFINFDTAPINKHSRGILSPTSSIVFTKSIRELFGSLKEGAYSLRATWDPGIDPSGNRRKLSGELVANLRVNYFNTDGSAQAAAPHGVATRKNEVSISSLPADRPANQASGSSTRNLADPLWYLLVVVLIMVLLGFIFWKRNKS